MCVFALPLLTESFGCVPWHHPLLPYLQESSLICQNPDLFTCCEGWLLFKATSTPSLAPATWWLSHRLQSLEAIAQSL